MRGFLRLFLAVAMLFSGSMIPGHSFAAPAPRVYGKSSLLSVLKDWEQSLNDRAMDAFERDLEREFILRLRFQVERRYTGDDASLIRILAFMLELEEQPQNMSLSYTTNYLRELLEAIRTIREPNENLARFIRQFTEASGIKNVMSANQFLQSRAYLNGHETATAREMTDEGFNEVAQRATSMDDEDTTPAVADLISDPPNSNEGLDPYEQIRLVGPGMPHPDPLIKSTSGAAQVSTSTTNPGANAETEAIDPELLAELQDDEIALGENGEPILPPAPRTQSIRSTDDRAILR